MSSLFDLPFEEPAESEPVARATPAPVAPVTSAFARAPISGELGRDLEVVASGRVGGPVARRVISVSELTAQLRDVLETTFAELWVEGELSNCKVWTTGHLYFTLKDGHSQVKGVMFRSALRHLKFKPVDGLRIVIRGRISVYDPKGEYQLVGEHMEPHGLGALQLAFDQLKRKLSAEGLFDAARKRPLPALPRRIGVVTSLDGAALRDIVRVLRRRYPNAHLVIAPARVQGDVAAGEIVRALRDLSRIEHIDVVIVGRGGGSLEDLWAFNEEKVARAIVGCRVPVISAVGHETDFTIADFVADLRAATPSAAAELVVRRKEDFFAYIDRLGDRLHGVMRTRLSRLESRLHTARSRPGYAALPGRLALRGRHLAELSASLRQAITRSLARRSRRLDGTLRQLSLGDPRHRLHAVRTRLATRDAALARAAAGRLHTSASHFHARAARLDALSPLAVLGRGYAVVWDRGHTRIVRDAAAVTPGEEVAITLARGELRAQVLSQLLDTRSRPS